VRYAVGYAKGSKSLNAAHPFASCFVCPIHAWRDMPALQELLRLSGDCVCNEAQWLERICWSQGLCTAVRSMLDMLLLLLLLLPMLQRLLWLFVKCR
jgi:hypothetical protein